MPTIKIIYDDIDMGDATIWLSDMVKKSFFARSAVFVDTGTAGRYNTFTTQKSIVISSVGQQVSKSIDGQMIRPKNIENPSITYQ